MIQIRIQVPLKNVKNGKRELVNWLVGSFLHLTKVHSVLSNSQIWPQASPTRSVVEPFHFGPGPAPASQHGGSGSSSSSSTSTVVHNLLLKKSFYKFYFSIYRGLFFSKKGTSALLCSSSTLFKETD